MSTSGGMRPPLEQRKEFRDLNRLAHPAPQGDTGSMADSATSYQMTPAEAQLPTPDTFGHGMFDSTFHIWLLTKIESTTAPFSSPTRDDTRESFDDLIFMDFLRDGITPGPLPFGLSSNEVDDFLSFPADVLDFGVDKTFTIPNINDQNSFSSVERPSTIPFLKQNAEETNPNTSGYTTPIIDSNVNIGIGAQAFKESVWLWTPAKEDNFAEQLNLSLVDEAVTPERQHCIDIAALHEEVTDTTRGLILVMVLKACNPVIYPQIVSHFPTTDLLSSLIHNFMSFHLQSEFSWLHIPTIQINNEKPEFLASMACAGAAISRAPEIRKLGLAIQEACRDGVEKLV